MLHRLDLNTLIYFNSQDVSHGAARRLLEDRIDNSKRRLPASGYNYYWITVASCGANSIMGCCC